MKTNILFIFILLSSLVHASESSLDYEGNPIPLSHYNVEKDYIFSEAITEKERIIWDRFTRIIPIKYRLEIKEFEPIDGNSGIDGSIHAVSEDKSIWVVQLDIRDSVSKSDLERTMIHEFAHLLTLRVDQIPLNKVSEEESIHSCNTYYSEDGCTNLNSYLNAFVSQFWLPYLPVYGVFQDSNQKVVMRRYRNSRNEFVTEYAATSPEEDIAESFAEYVLTDNLPNSNSISNRKISFFSNYPQLKKIRTSIREGLLSH